MRVLICGFIVILALFGSPPNTVAAQGGEASADLGTLEDRLADLNHSVQELVALLREYVQAHQVELMMKQLEMKRNNLRPLETRLRRVRSDVKSLETEQAEMEARLAAMEAEADTEGGPDEAELEHIRSQTEMMKKLLTDRLWNLNQEILDLENDLARGREELLELEEQLKERLGFR